MVIGIVKWLLGIIGVTLILVSLFIDDKKAENILEWIGFGSIWAAVIMKFADPALGSRARNKEKNN